MRIDKIACLCALVSLPSVTVAQTSSTPLPAAPRVEPLYPSQSAARPSTPAVAKPVVYAQTPVVQQTTPAPAAPPAPAVVAPVKAAPAPVFVAPVAQPAAPVLAAQVLPPNTDVLVRLDEEVSSKGRKVGHTFKMTVAQDVMHAGQVVIPRGTPAQGSIAWRTGKGMFGKSAKMEITVDHLDLAGRKVPLFGRFREAGDGNTGATVGVAVATGLIAAAFVTGRSAVFAAGREFRVTTREALPMTAPEQAPVVASTQTVASK